MSSQRWLAGGVLVAAMGLGAQQTQPVEKVYGVQPFSPEQIAAVKATGSGISGPGKPVGDDWGLGAADGPGGHVVVTAANRDKIASGSVVTEGLLPAIKPILDVHMRDTQITLGGDGNYYMTGSTGTDIWEYNDGIELWKSSDLEHWQYLGLVWSIEKDGGWEKDWRLKNGRPIRSIWAPEIHYLRGNYYLCFGMPPGGMSILKSTTGKPEGPYVHATNPNRPIWGGIGPIEKSFLIDPTLFEDTDGKVYFTYGPANLIARMKDDLSDFAEPLRPVTLLHPDHDPALHGKQCVPRGMNDIGFEGATLLKHNGKYYLGSTDEYHGRYTMMLAVSDNIYGPYTDREPTVASNGGTGFFQGKDGFLYTTIFGDDNQAPWRSMPGLLRVEFNAEGHVQLAKTQPAFILRKRDGK
jgi:GH43 family beta-xylosidase